DRSPRWQSSTTSTLNSGVNFLRFLRAMNTSYPIEGLLGGVHETGVGPLRDVHVSDRRRLNDDRRGIEDVPRGLARAGEHPRDRADEDVDAAVGERQLRRRRD
ncbi:MAG: hypothetical protein AB8I08_39540, partial [Sandaracinaceae bacterium]